MNVNSRLDTRETAATPDVNRRIAECLRELRAQHGLSLEELAAKSGVSRSMISLIERGESSPTATVIEKLAISFGVPMAALFNRSDERRPEADPLSRRDDQPEWQDPGSGYVRRNVSPQCLAQPLQLVDVHF